MTWGTLETPRGSRSAPFFSPPLINEGNYLGWESTHEADAAAAAHFISTVILHMYPAETEKRPINTEIYMLRLSSLFV